MTPFVSDPDFTLYVGDALTVLQGLPDESVHCCVTSPPYWGLRDYGTPGQLGLEATPDEYVAAIVNVFREVRRVLRDDGTLWLNLGDSYHGGGGGNYGDSKSTRTHAEHLTNVRNRIELPDLKPKDLVGIPWRVAFALQADGWYLRSDIIWSKPNPMPESVTDRPTKAHEYVFLLSKQPRYFFDQEAVREAFQGPDDPAAFRFRYGAARVITDGAERLGDRAEPGRVLVPRVKQAETLDDSEGEAPRGPDGRRATTVEGRDGSLQHRDGERWPNGGRNLRSVWEIATQPYPDAHFATFPEALPDRCIRAGSSERGCCPECGAAWVREVERTSEQRQERWSGSGRGNGVVSGGGHEGRTGQWHGAAVTTGWTPTCDCSTVGPEWGADPYPFPPVPCTVLDPFLGSGTTALVARKLGRKSIGIELSQEYAQLAARRLQQLSLLAEPA